LLTYIIINILEIEDKISVIVSVLSLSLICLSLELPFPTSFKK